METGRKFWITVYGVTGVLVYAMLAGVRGFVASEAVYSALATMVLAFCGGNATATIAATLAQKKESTTTDTTMRQIIERRDDATGVDPAP